MPQRQQAVKYPSELVWAAVAAADRKNHGHYVKSGSRPPEGVEARCSRDLVMSILADTESITDGDREHGQRLHQHFQGLLFGQLGKGTLNEFMNTVVKITAMKQVGNYEVAVMASLPSVYRRSTVREDLENQYNQITAQSDYISSVGTRVELPLRVYQQTYSERYQSHIITAVSGSNAVKFFTSYGPDFKPNTEFTVKATVKRHSVNDRNGRAETWLTRVKIVN